MYNSSRAKIGYHPDSPAGPPTPSPQSLSQFLDSLPENPHPPPEFLKPFHRPSPRPQNFAL